MDDMSEDEDRMFDQVAITKMANECVTNIIGDKIFSDKESKVWMNKIVESLLTQLQTLQKPFKLSTENSIKRRMLGIHHAIICLSLCPLHRYVITVLLEQKNGAGLYSSCDCRWDKSTDGLCTVNWTNETTHGLITVFGLHIQ